MSDTVRVRIAYSPVKSRIGKVEELPVAEARALIREGRAQLVTDQDTPEVSEPAPTDSPQADPGDAAKAETGGRKSSRTA